MIGKRSLVALLAASALAACGRSSGSGGGSGGTGGSGGDDQERPAGPTIAAADGVGTFLPAQPRALLAGADSSRLLVGTRGVAIDPTWFGRPAPTGEDAPHSEIVAGLLDLDAATGAVRVLRAADGLPTIPYEDPFETWGDETASIFDLAWVEADRSFVAAGWNHLIRGTLQEDGSWSFASVRLRAPDAAEDALVVHVEAAGDRIYAAGDQGLAVVRAENLSVEGWVDFGGAVNVHHLAAGTFAGAQAVAVIWGPQDEAPAHVGLVHGDGALEVLPLPAGFLPTAALVLPEQVIVGVQTPDRAGAVYAWEADAHGAFGLQQKMGPMELLTASRSTWPVVPNAFLLDAHNASLIIGGRVVENAPGGPGGGLVQVDHFAQAGLVAGARARDLFPRQDPRAGELPWTVDALATDGRGGLYVAGRQLCNERKALQQPVLKVERASRHDEPRLVRPWVDGVRSVAVHPGNGEVWLGLRSEVGGMACDGIAVGQGICRLRADGACEITTPSVNVNADLFAPTPAAVALAFGDVEKNQLAIATLRDALFVQTHGAARALPTQFEPGLNLRHTSAAWGDGDQLWVGSVIEWNDHDGPVVNDRGPHGLGFFQLDEAGVPVAMRRYVRNPSDNQPDVDVGGLRSNMVYDVLPVGSGKALVALGVERVAQAYDHAFPEAAENGTTGGIALVDGDVVTAIEAPAGVAMEEVVALARGADGTLFALDTNDGLFVVDVEARKASRWTTATWDVENERALALAVDGTGRVAVGTTHGLHLFGADKGVTEALAGMSAGYVWSLHFAADGVLLAGTDEGLRRIAVGEATLPAFGPAQLAERWPFAIAPRLVTPGSACVVDDQCPDGSVCGCTVQDGATTCACSAPAACDLERGGVGCACNPAAAFSCRLGLECEADEAGSSCRQPPCGGVAGCACQADVECAEGFVCHFDFAGGTCREDSADACLQDCSCTGEGATPDQCLPGWFCEWGWGGMRSCVEQGEPDCAESCSCEGEGTENGCPIGTSCVETPMGNACAWDDWNEERP